MNIPDDIKVTTEILWKGAMFFAMIDVILITILTRLIKPNDLLNMKWRLIIFMAIYFCILGGLWGLITHILAIHRGILDKPPMLQGASSISALTIATFEFIFYWSICLGLTFLFQRLGSKLFRRE